MQFLANEQASFRNGFTTIDHVFTLYIQIDLYLNTRKRIILCFCRPQAFDYVNRKLLWKPPLRFTIKGQVY